MIYLFDKNEKLIHILQRDVVIEAIQEEVLNELVTLSVVLPLFYYREELKVNLSKEVEKADYIGHFDQNKDFQLYKIIRVGEPDVIEVLGIHIAFDELRSSNIIKDRRLTNSTAENALQVSLEASGWQVGQVDDLGVKSYTLYYIPPLEAISKWRERFDAEIRFRMTFDGQKITGRYVDGVKQVGRDTHNRFVYGHNALEVIREQDFSEIYTAIIGRGKGEETLDDEGEATGGYGRRIGFDDITWTSPDGLLHKPAGQNFLEYPERTALYGLPNGKPRYVVAIFEDVEDQQTLINETYKYLLEVSRPMVLFKASVANVGDVQLGDRVNIIRKELDIHYTTRIQKVERNLLNNMLTIVEIGDYGFFRTDKSKERVDDALDEVGKELDSVRTATRSRFEQTDEKIELAVERLTDDIIEAYSQITITADEIRSEVGAIERSLEGQITSSANTVISQVAGMISLKADSSTVTSLGSRVTNAELRVDAVAGTISSKVSYSDYNGSTIASLINQSAYNISISAQAIDLAGIVRVADSIELGYSNSYATKAIKFNGSNAWIYSSGDFSLTLDASYVSVAGTLYAASPSFGYRMPVITGTSQNQGLSIGLSASGELTVYRPNGTGAAFAKVRNL